MCENRGFDEAAILGGEVLPRYIMCDHCVDKEAPYDVQDLCHDCAIECPCQQCFSRLLDATPGMREELKEKRGAKSDKEIWMKGLLCGEQMPKMPSAEESLDQIAGKVNRVTEALAGMNEALVQLNKTMVTIDNTLRGFESQMTVNNNATIACLNALRQAVLMDMSMME